MGGPGTLYPATLRTSQINGCSVRVDVHVEVHSREMRATGGPPTFTVSAWWETPYYSDAERRAGAGGGRDARGDLGSGPSRGLGGGNRELDETQLADR